MLAAERSSGELGGAIRGSVVGGGLFSADPGSHLVVAHLLDQVSCFALGLGSALQLAHLRPAAITRTRLSGRMAILPPGTDNRLRAKVTLRAPDRLQRPVPRRPAPVQAGAELGEHFHHVAHQVVINFPVVEHH